MKLPKNFFANLTATGYRDYLRLLPPIKREHTKAIIMLIFTFLALSFFGLVAINPTIATIINLQKQINDNEFVLKQLTTKMNNLSALQQQYTSLTNDLPLIFTAIPKQAEAPLLAGQIQSLIEQNNLSLISLHIPDISLIGTEETEDSFFLFTFEASGNYTDCMKFIDSLGKSARIITIEEISIKKDLQQKNILLIIKARAYIQKE